MLRQEKGYCAKNSSQNFPASQIWGKLQERVYRSCIHDVDQLKSRLIKEWEHFHQVFLDGPVHLAVDNEFVFVVDRFNHRVTLLSPTLHYVRQVVSRDQLKWRPEHVYLDTDKRYLYVTDNEWKDGAFRAGRVVVFIV